MKMTEIIINLINYLRVVGPVAKVWVCDDSFGTFAIETSEGEVVEITVQKKEKNHD